MLDGFKTYNLISNNLIDNKLLDFHLLLNVNTGEVSNNKKTAYYNGLRFERYNDGNTKLKGSFHNFNNEGRHNYNDYSFNDLKDTIRQFEVLFSIDIESTHLNGLEFGINIKTTLSIKDVFKSIISYRKTKFQRFNIEGAKGIECIKQQYIIKIYDKSHQYQLNENIIRFEIKVKKMAYFKNKGVNISSLQSLVNQSEILKLRGILLDVWDDIHFTDYDIGKLSLKSLERRYFDYGNNPDSWFTSTKEETKKHYRYISKFNDLIRNYSIKKYQSILSNEIEKKSDLLLQSDKKNGGILTDNKDNWTQKNGGKLTNVLTVNNGGVLTTKKII